MCSLLSKQLCGRNGVVLRRRPQKAPWIPAGRYVWFLKPLRPLCKLIGAMPFSAMASWHVRSTSRKRILQATGQDALDHLLAKEDATVLFPKRRSLDIICHMCCGRQPTSDSKAEPPLAAEAGAPQ